jgi:periplasmic divalent cation tolerance protein
VIVVYVTCPSPAVGQRLAKALVSRRVAACVNMLPGVSSTYVWDGVVERAREALLIIKTTRAAFDRLRRLVVQLHPYDVPEIIALPLVAAHPPYAAWVADSVSQRR